MQPVRLGIIGCGAIGNVHLGVAKRSSGIEVAAVADANLAAAQASAAKHAVPSVYRDGHALISDPRVEGVVLATPVKGRTELAVEAFAAGKHVLLEKPVAMNAREVERLIAARGSLVAACCSSRLRSTESARAAAECIASGALGELRVVHCRVVQQAGERPTSAPPAWRLKRELNAGGILTNWGCYDLDYLLGITGWTLAPRTALARTWNVPQLYASHVAPGSDAETHYVALIACAGGEMISMERGEYMSAVTEAAWRIVGSRASLRLQMTPGIGKKIMLDEGSTDHGVSSRVIWEGDEDPDLQHAGPITDFARAIREHAPPLTGLEQSLVIAKITDAIYASAASGAAVAVQ